MKDFKETNVQHRFGGNTVVCPICGNKDLFTDNSIRMHIAAVGKAELWNKALHGDKETPHFDFYKNNTVAVRRKIVWKI